MQLRAAELRAVHPLRGGKERQAGAASSLTFAGIGR